MIVLEHYISKVKISVFNSEFLLFFKIIYSIGTKLTYDVVVAINARNATECSEYIILAITNVEDSETYKSLKISFVLFLHKKYSKF